MEHIISRPAFSRRALADAGSPNGWPIADARSRLAHVEQLPGLAPALLGYRRFRRVYWAVLDALARIAPDHLIEAYHVDHLRRGYRVSLPGVETGRQLRLEYRRILVRTR